MKRQAVTLKTHYHTLGGLHRGSTDEEVHDQWRPLAAEFHPDKNPANLKRATELNAARAGLKTAAARKLYNDLLDLCYSYCKTCEGKGFKKRQRGMAKIVVRCEDCAGSGVIT